MGPGPGRRAPLSGPGADRHHPLQSLGPRQHDYQDATLQFLALVPQDEAIAPLVLATTLPVQTLADARGVAWVYAQR